MITTARATLVFAIVVYTTLLLALTLPTANSYLHLAGETAVGYALSIFFVDQARQIVFVQSLRQFLYGFAAVLFVVPSIRLIVALAS